MSRYKEDYLNNVNKAIVYMKWNDSNATVSVDKCQIKNILLSLSELLLS